MNCPKCGSENPEHARYCSFCGSALNGSPRSSDHPKVRTDDLARASAVLAVLSLCTFGITAVPAIILGIVSLVRIERSGGRLAGAGLAKVAIAVPALALALVLIFKPVTRLRDFARRGICQNKLSGMQFTLLIYSNDYDDALPRAAGPNSVWGPTPDWKATSISDAYGLGDGANGQASMSASLYLMLKYGYVTPHGYICPADRGVTEFKALEYGESSLLIYLWDFGPDPARHVSYSYHMPYGPYALTTSGDPGMAVAAGRNPWQRSPAAKARDFKAFDPNGTRAQVKAGNTMPHKFEGQNVLFLDGHVAFEKTALCGTNGDNIYTSWSGTDIRRGTPPKLGDQPRDRLDSLLVNDPPKSDDK